MASSSLCDRHFLPAVIILQQHGDHAGFRMRSLKAAPGGTSAWPVLRPGVSVGINARGDTQVLLITNRWSGSGSAKAGRQGEALGRGPGVMALSQVRRRQAHSRPFHFAPYRRWRRFMPWHQGPIMRQV